MASFFLSNSAGAARSRWFLRVIPALAALIFAAGASAQTPTCTLAANAAPVHAEGLAERVSDIVLTCTGGTAASTVSGTAFVSLNANITNRLDDNGAPTGVSVAVSAGTGGALLLNSATTILIPGISYTVPATPASPVTITISGIRAAVASVPSANGLPTVSATVGAIGLSIAGSSVTVAIGFSSLLTSTFNGGVPCNGSSVPASLDFTSFASQTPSTTVRVTEASPAAFSVKGAGGDSGFRILIRFSGYPTGARVFAPDAVVGNDGALATSTGVLDGMVNSGTYSPGQLLLARVNSADANGAGGGLASTAGGSAAAFSNVTELTLTGGAGYVVYEVVDGNPNLQESVQIPLFVTALQTVCTGVTTLPTYSVAAAPVSSVNTATATDAIPRFVSSTPGADCNLLGDCSAAYFPMFSVDTTPVNLTASSQGVPVSANFMVTNSGGGIVPYTTSVTYQQTGVNWLSVTPSAAQNTKSLQITADPSALQPGVYTAKVTVNAGTFGTFTIPVTLTVGAPAVTVTSILNAASFLGPIAPGSYVAIFGANFAGQNVSVTFNGLPASVIFAGASQINAIAPMALSGPFIPVVVTVDGRSSLPLNVALALNQPGIFNPGIVNGDGTVNSVASPAKRGSFVAVYLTGFSIPLSGPVTVNIGSQIGLAPLYAGAQPTLAALDQVNVALSASLPATSPTPLQICISGPAGQACSNTVNLYLQ